MIIPKLRFVCVVLVILSTSLQVVHARNDKLAGAWTIDRRASTAIDPWSRIQLDIGLDGKDLTIERTVNAGRRISSNTYALREGETVDVDMGWWTGNRHIGAYADPNTKASVKADWIDCGSVLRVESNFVLVTSQGKTPVRTYSEYRLSPDGKTLTLITLRSSRNKPMVEVYHRSTDSSKRS